MFRSLTRALVNFRDREDGPTAVEYAVMAGLAVIGVCIAAFTARSTAHGDGFIVTFRNGTRNGAATMRGPSRGAVTDAAVQNGIEMRGAAADHVSVTGSTSDRKGDARNRNAEASLTPTAGAGPTDKAKSPDATGAATKSGKAGVSMSEEDARRAIIGLLKTYPKTFNTPTATIETAPVVREKDHIRIDSFFCNLKSNEFAYRPAPGQSAGSAFGLFYRNDKGEWTGKITKMTTQPGQQTAQTATP
jgi:Flp pilus assembly pilin Flp